MSLADVLRGLIGRAAAGGQSIQEIFGRVEPPPPLRPEALATPERLRQSLETAARGAGAVHDFASRIDPFALPPSVPFLSRGVASALGIGGEAQPEEAQKAQEALALDELAAQAPPAPEPRAPGERLEATALLDVQELPFDPNPDRILQIYRERRDPHTDEIAKLYAEMARAELESAPSDLDRKQMAVLLLAAAALGASQAAASGDFRQTLAGVFAGVAAGALSIAENQIEAEKLKREARLRAVKTLLEGQLKVAELDAAERDRMERLLQTYQKAQAEYLRAIEPSFQIINNFTLGIKTREIRGRTIIQRIDAKVIDATLREATILDKVGALRGPDDPGAVYAPNGIKLNLSALTRPEEIELHKWASLTGRMPQHRQLWFDIQQQVIEEFRKSGALEGATTQGRTSDLATAITLATNLAFARAVLGGAGKD